MGKPESMEAWSRHYDILFWTVTSIMSAAIVMLYVGCVGCFKLWLAIPGYLLTFIAFYFSMSFAELRQLCRNKSRNHLWDDMQQQRRVKLQWFIYILYFILIQWFWIILFISRILSSDWLERSWLLFALATIGVVATILMLLSAFFVRRLQEPNKINPSIEKKGKLVEKPRVVVGAIIAGIGTLIILSANLNICNRIYDKALFSSLGKGIYVLTNFEVEKSEPDGRQKVKTLEKGKEGFKDIRYILENNVPILTQLNIEKITNRREKTYREESGQYIDVMNVVHAYDSMQEPNYFLVTTESNLRSWISGYKKVLIEGTGALLVVFGIFFPYIMARSLFHYRIT